MSKGPEQIVTEDRCVGGSEQPRTVGMDGRVMVQYPRSRWQWRKTGWHPHVDGLGRRCWIRFSWPPEVQSNAMSDKPKNQIDEPIVSPAVPADYAVESRSGGDHHCRLCGATVRSDLVELHQHWHQRKGDRGEV